MRLLSYGKETRPSHLECELYCKDTAGAMEDMKVDSENEGFIERYVYCKESKTIDMVGRIHHDMFQQDKLLLNKHCLDLQMNFFIKFNQERV